MTRITSAVTPLSASANWTVTPGMGTVPDRTCPETVICSSLSVAFEWGGTSRTRLATGDACTTSSYLPNGRPPNVTWQLCAGALPITRSLAPSKSIFTAFADAESHQGPPTLTDTEDRSEGPRLQNDVAASRMVVRNDGPPTFPSYTGVTTASPGATP